MDTYTNFRYDHRDSQMHAKRQQYLVIVSLTISQPMLCSFNTFLN